MANLTNSDIVLYTMQSPNGIKISILLEELGVPYKVIKMDVQTNEHKADWFTAINPNGRIPALTDKLSDGTEVCLWESGAMLLYIVQRYDTEHRVSYPVGTKEYYEVMSWLFFQCAGLGPMQGQAYHFLRYAPERTEHAISHYTNEARRLFGVLDRRLVANSKHGFLVGDRLTIADIACWPWVAAGPILEIDMDEFPALKAWEERLLQRPNLDKGRNVPDPHVVRELARDPEALAEHIGKNRKWVLEGHAANAQKHVSK